MNGLASKRGAFIVLEGCDRSGKSTQCRKLVEKLWQEKYTAKLLSFPDRSTATGRIINNYLANKEEIPDEAVHLLFSANRWETEPKMRELIAQGVTLVVDRYSYSGVAYSCAKSGMDWEWCRGPEKGLLKPDVVFFLRLSEKVAQERAGYGNERYENKTFQNAVYDNFMKLKDDNWKIIDADKDVEVLHEELWTHAKAAITKAEDSDVKTLW